MVKRGFDIDGVLCGTTTVKRVKKWSHMKGDERRAYQEARRNHIITAKPYLILSPLFKDTEEVHIITGRKLKDKLITEEWIGRFTNKEVLVHYLEGEKTRDNMVIHKAKCINELELQEYYEDDIKIARRLQRLCLNAKIILVGGI